jgi:hypothetical protein
MKFSDSLSAKHFNALNSFEMKMENTINRFRIVVQGAFMNV